MNEVIEVKNIAYWPDGYLIADDDAEEQAEILDSVDAFGSEHTILEVPIGSTYEEMQNLVNQELSRAA